MISELLKKHSRISANAQKENELFSKYDDFKNLETRATKSMFDCQVKEGDFDHTYNKNDRMVFSSVKEKSEIESLDYICVEQNHQIILPDSFKIGKLAVSKEIFKESRELSKECSIKKIRKETQNSDLNKFEKINNQNINMNGQRSIFSKDIAENKKHSLRIKRTNKIGLNNIICTNIDKKNNTIPNFTPLVDNGEPKRNLNGSSDKIDKNDIVENKPKLPIEFDSDLTEPDLTKFYQNKHRFKKEEFQYYVDLGKRDSYNSFIKGN